MESLGKRVKFVSFSKELQSFQSEYPNCHVSVKNSEACKMRLLFHHSNIQNFPITRILKINVVYFFNLNTNRKENIQFCLLFQPKYQ